MFPSRPHNQASAAHRGARPQTAGPFVAKRNETGSCGQPYDQQEDRAISATQRRSFAPGKGAAENDAQCAAR
jgi:hypothetical protein